VANIELVEALRHAGGLILRAQLLEFLGAGPFAAIKRLVM
jgi:hypothetical protein